MALRSFRFWDTEFRASTTHGDSVDPIGSLRDPGLEEVEATPIKVDQAPAGVP